MSFVLFMNTSFQTQTHWVIIKFEAILSNYVSSESSRSWTLSEAFHVSRSIWEHLFSSGKIWCAMMFPLVGLVLVAISAGESCESGSCEPVSLLQSQRSQKIIVKGPSGSGGTASQKLAPTCAQGFNEAFAKCLGGKNPYLMVLVTNEDDTKAYCAYTGGWAQSPENYPDHSACFVSPGEKGPLFFDTSVSPKTLSNWDKQTIVSGDLKQDYTSLSCTGSGDSPCKSTVTSKYARQLTKEARRKSPARLVMRCLVYYANLLCCHCSWLDILVRLLQFLSAGNAWHETVSWTVLSTSLQQLWKMAAFHTDVFHWDIFSSLVTLIILYAPPPPQHLNPWPPHPQTLKGRTIDIVRLARW